MTSHLSPLRHQAGISAVAGPPVYLLHLIWLRWGTDALPRLKSTEGVKAQVGFTLSAHNLQAFAATCAAPGFRRDAYSSMPASPFKVLTA